MGGLVFKVRLPGFEEFVAVEVVEFLVVFDALSA